MDQKTGIWTAVTLNGRILRFLSNYLPNMRGKIRLLILYSRCVLNDRLLLENCNGIRIVVNPMDYIGGFLLRGKSFEADSIQLCAKLLRNGGVFYDIGSNFGLYCMSLASISNVRCVAVEALPQVAISFLSNLALNPQLPISLYLGAASQKHGQLPFLSPHDGNCGTGRVSSHNSSLKVASIRLDDILIPCTDADRIVMKIDIEGHELEALQGIDLSRAEAPYDIITEYEPTLTTESVFKEMRALLMNAGYRPFTIFGSPIAEFRNELLPENNIWWTRNPIDISR